MAEMVEHQATVDTGLKMKIKRKNLMAKSSSSSCEAKCKTAPAEDKNGNLKSRRAKPDAACDSGNDATSSSDGKPPDGKPVDSSESTDHPQKRRRNAKPVRTAKSQNGEDHEPTKGSKPAKSEPESLKSNSSANSAKDKPKNPKAPPTTEKTTSMEKPSRKRCAPSTLPPPSSTNIAPETTKPKSARLAGSDKETIEDKMADLRKSGFNTKIDTDECQKKMDLKTQITPDSPSPVNCLSSIDPYEFVAKFEDSAIQTPIKKFKSDKSDGTTADQSNGTGTGHQDASTETCTVGVTTDPDCLGPCEPGTSVVLEGIVWSESNNGILVVNVTWRGKTYVGTLMDTTKHNWASPRFCEESPVPELDWRLPKSKRSCITPVTEVLEGRRLRKCRRNVAPSNSCANSSKAALHSTLRQSPVSSDIVLGRRKGRTLENLESSSSLPSSSSSQGPKRSGDGDGALPGSEVLLECNEFNCKKKFRHISALNYHQSHAHRKTSVVEIFLEPSTKVAPSSCGVVRDSESGSAVQGVERELVGEISESASDKEHTCNVEVQSFMSDVMISAAGKSVAEDLEVSEAGCLPTSVFPPAPAVSVVGSCHALSQTSTDALLPSADDIKNSGSIDLSSEDAAKPRLHGTGKQGAASCGKVSDDKEAETTTTTLIVSSRCDGDKVQLPDVCTTHSPSVSSPHPSNISCLKTFPLVCATKDGKPNNTVKNHVAEPTVVEPIGSSPLLGVSSIQRSPSNSDISDPSDGVGVSTGHEINRIHKEESKAKKQLKPNENKHHHHHHHHYNKTKQETPGNSHSSGSTTHSIHHSSSSSSSHDAIPEQTVKMTKETETLRNKESIASSTNSFAKPLISEEKKVFKRELVDTEGLQVREHRPCQDLAISRHISTTSAAVATTINKSTAPYGCSIDHNAYHMQVLGPNCETRSHYERWLMEHGHQYLQQQQQQQQQRCFNRLIHVEDAGCLTTESKPVDMSSKSQAGVDRDRSGQSVPKPPTPLSTRHPDNPPPPSTPTVKTGSGNNSCSDARNPPVEKPSGLVLREKPENARRSHRHKDTVKDRSEKTVSTTHRTSCLSLSHSSTSPNHNNTCTTTATTTTTATPVSKSLNPVATNISPYASEYLKNFVPDPRYGYGRDVSYIDWSVGTGPLNSKLLDLDSKQVVSSGSDHRRPAADPQQHALDVLRFQSTMYGKSDCDQKFDQSNSLLRDFGDKDSNHPEKNKTAAAQRENNELSDHNNSSLTLRHLHTHHHTHLVGAAYPIYGSYSGLMSPVPAMVPPVPPVIPPTYLPK